MVSARGLPRFPKLLWNFPIGLIFGFTMAFVVMNGKISDLLDVSVSPPPPTEKIEPLGKPKEEKKVETKTSFEFSDDEIASAVYNEVKVLCWVPTLDYRHDSHAFHVKATWGKRCNKLIFVSSKEDPDLPAIKFANFTEHRNALWEYLKDYDWFLKADDDTFVVLENLRLLLLNHDPNEPIHFGCKFKLPNNQTFMSGGAGYILSREALKLFVENGLGNKTKCRVQDGEGSEDAEMGICLEYAGAVAGDSRDGLGRHRFLPFAPHDHMFPGKVDMSYWFWRYITYPMEPNMDCCSDYIITLHYVVPRDMYVLEYSLYRARVFGREKRTVIVPPDLAEKVNGVPRNTQLLMIIKHNAKQTQGKDDYGNGRKFPASKPKLNK